MKTMKMNNDTDTNLAGIYAKKSTEITAVGDGFTSQVVKSPVIKTENLIEENEDTIINIINILKKENENEINDVKKDSNTNESPSKSDVLTSDLSKEASLDEHVDEEIETEKLNNSDEVVIYESGDDDKNSNSSSETNIDTSLLNKGDLNAALIPYPRCEDYYGSERWNKARQVMQKVGYGTWEINVMFGALDKNLETKFGKRKLPFRDDVINKKPCSTAKSTTKKPNPNIISGVLLHAKYSTFDLRANIGDANHPNFHIIPEYRNNLYMELNLLLKRLEWMPHEPLLCFNYINQLLMIECKSQRILDYIVNNINMVNRCSEGADFVMVPRSCERKNILIYIPYSYSDVKTVLDIIKKQNRLPVAKWKLNSSQKSEEGICLDVEVDGGTYLRLIQDQDDIFFLMKKATIKLPANDDS